VEKVDNDWTIIEDNFEDSFSSDGEIKTPSHPDSSND